MSKPADTPGTIAKPFPGAPCHGCRNFRGFSRIIPPDFDPVAGTYCSKVKPVPLAVLRGGDCKDFEAGDHWEPT